MIRSKIAKIYKTDSENILFVEFKVDKINSKLSIICNLGGSEKPLDEFSEFAELLEVQFSKRVKIDKLIFYSLNVNFGAKSVNSELFYQDEKGNKLNLSIKDVF